jgi:hypothetical protein
MHTYQRSHICCSPPESTHAPAHCKTDTGGGNAVRRLEMFGIAAYSEYPEQDDAFPTS